MVIDLSKKNSNNPAPILNNFLAPTPLLSNRSLQAVSQHRRQTLEQEMSRSHHSGDLPTDFMGKTAAGNVIGIVKNATGTTFSSGSGGGNYRGSGGTSVMNPELYSPLWLNSNLNMPRDRATINAWSRAYVAVNPMVANAINLHSTYPISKLNIKCKDKDIEKFFAEMCEEIDLINVCSQMAQEFWTLGETFIYAELDQNSRKWSRLLIQNPDYIVVANSVIAGEPVMSLRPDENLKRICTSNRPADVQQRQKLAPNIVEHVRRNENIPLDNFHFHHLARKISPYDARGTGLIVPCFKSLMLWDMIKECKYVQAQDLINPWTIIKVGGGTADYRPVPADLEAWREIIEQGTYDKQFKIITHDAVTFETVNRGAGIYDTSGDSTQLLKEIYTGLMVPSVLMDGGQDTSYANGGVALDVLRQRYLQFRNMMTVWLRRKLFAPISRINEFYEYDGGKRTLIVPDIDWNHMALFDVDTYIQNLVQLSAPDENKRVSVQTLYRSLGLSWEEEQRRIKQEAIQDAINKKEIQALAVMTLNDLRALGPEDEIQEDTQLLPGQTGLPGEEGMPPSGGSELPPGLPPLPPPPGPPPSAPPPA